MSLPSWKSIGHQQGPTADPVSETQYLHDGESKKIKKSKVQIKILSSPRQTSRLKVPPRTTSGPA